MSMRKLAVSLGFAGSLILATASSAFAVTCTEKLSAVQTEGDGKVVVLFPNGTWHVIASSSSVSRSDRLSVVMAAFLSGKSVRLSYDGSSCTATDYGAVPNSIRIID